MILSLLKLFKKQGIIKTEFKLVVTGDENWLFLAP